jgi:hypothetical protein
MLTWTIYFGGFSPRARGTRDQKASNCKDHEKDLSDGVQREYAERATEETLRLKAASTSVGARPRARKTILQE